MSPKGKILGKDANANSLYEKLVRYRNMDGQYPRLIIKEVNQVNPVLQKIV